MLLQPESPAGVVFDTRSFDTPSQELTKLLRHRMSKPQRHRLLHGFPLAAAMLWRYMAWLGSMAFPPNRQQAASHPTLSTLQPSVRNWAGFGR